MATLSRPAVIVSPTSTVMEAIRTMADAHVGCILVVEGSRLEGIFTERDVMLRVVLAGNNPQVVQVGEVMTSPVITIPMRTTGDDTLKAMIEGHIRHLPVVDDSGRVLGVVSMRGMLQEKVADLTQQLDSLESYITADGIGG